MIEDAVFWTGFLGMFGCWVRFAVLAWHSKLDWNRTTHLAVAMLLFFVVAVMSS